MLTSIKQMSQTTGRIILPPVDWDLIPIPHEIENLDGFLKSDYIEELTQETRDKYTPFVIDLVNAVQPHWTQKDLQTKINSIRRLYRINPRNSDTLDVYRQLRSTNAIKQNLQFERIIRKKFNRSTSGVVVITTLLGPGKFSCPMNCKYCPNDPAISRSYLLNEPAVRRGFKNGWDAVRQFMDCANRLYRTGHEVTKVEIIIEGGTFGSYPHDYIDEYFRDLYYAANIFSGEEIPTYDPSNPLSPSQETLQALQHASSTGGQLRQRLSLEQELEINQTAKCAIIGITVETRPDWINKKEILRFRRLGVTRVQLGIQHLDDKILDLVDRRCPTRKTVKAIYLLKENGFKVDGHFMPDLPGSSYEKDLEMFTFLFSQDNEDIQCDQLKVYPTMTTDYTEILEWYKEGKYHPYAELDGGKQITDLLNYVSLSVPPWIRLNRVVRDIPTGYIKAGLKRVNLRQDINDKLESTGLIPRDIRGREVKGRQIDHLTARLWIDQYRSSKGDEYFISYENGDRTILYGFIRLRLGGFSETHDPEMTQSLPPSPRYFHCLQGAALIRELHVYGELVHQSEDNTGTQTQHLGIGRLLMATAEKIAWENGYRRCAVISGIGVRGYYQKLGYKLDETYMVKVFNSENDITKSPTKSPTNQVRQWSINDFIVILIIIAIAFNCYIQAKITMGFF